jgi:hypothetical protein
MKELLNQSTELPMSKYSSISNAEFMGQTSMEDNGSYWVVMKSEDKLFKFHMFS